MNASLSRIAAAHGANWAVDSRYRWAWYVWPQAASVVAAVWLLAGVPSSIPGGAWAKPEQDAGVAMDQLRDAAKTDPAARERLKKLAEAGDPFAEFSYATLFDPTLKYTNTLDAKTALEWYVKAAKQGHGVAQLNLGLSYYFGLPGLPLDYNKAFPWLLRAAQQGEILAQRDVGESYKYGRGINQDPKLAAQWFRTAAEKGDAYSQAEMGDAYFGGSGVETNISEALAWWRKAADQKESYAQRKLGIAYLYGQNGAPKDLSAAFEYLKQSADAGDSVAQYYFAYMYDQGIFVQKDVPTAVTWYRKSADQGYADAQELMGLAYMRGITVPKNLDTARAWLEKAKANGSQKAADDLKSLGEGDTGVRAAPAAAPAQGSIAMAAPCLNEQNPRTAYGICRVFLANTGGLEKSTLAAVFSKLSWASVTTGDYKEALSYSKKALDIEPISSLHYVAGEAYDGLNDPKNAVEEYSAAISMAPKYILALTKRGEAYLRMGNSEHAKADLEAALAINPRFKPARDALKRLN
jgi:TPR repeat protein